MKCFCMLFLNLCLVELVILFVQMFVDQVADDMNYHTVDCHVTDACKFYPNSYNTTVW